jgi:hypothetical protein
VLSIETNDQETPSVEVNLAAAGASCDRGCPIANGTPSCDSGACAVGSCNAGFFDVDRSATNGCECRDVGNDPGAFCADALWMGSLGEGDRANHTGMLPAEGDEDVLRFYANDDTGFFDEDFDVNVRLESADPSIRLCVYRHNTSGHQTECFFENESCPGDRSFRRGGSLGPDDSADFIVRVRRNPGSAPSCTPYTVFVRNG